MISSGVNLVMTAIGFGVSTLFIVYICARLIFARIQLHAARRRRAASSFPVSSQTDLAVLERGLHGLEPVMISNFPTKKYGEDGSSPCAEHSQCTVCLSEYRPGDTLRILPNCGHYFHANCIDIWLQQHSTCPVCRVSLHEFPEKRRLMQPLPSSARRYHHRGMASCHSPHCILANQSLTSISHSCPMMAAPLQETRYTHEESAADGIPASPSLNDARQFLKDSAQDRCTHEESTADGIRASPSLNDAGQFSKDTGQDRYTHEESTADGIQASPSLNDARQFSQDTSQDRYTRKESTADGIQAPPSPKDARQCLKDTGQDHAGSQSSAS